MTISDQEQLQQIWDQIDTSEELDEPARVEVLQKMITKLKQLAESGYDPAWYPLGYAYYCHPDRKLLESEISTRMVETLLTSISRDVEPSLSRLYLAYHYFDLGEFGEASKYVSGVGDLDHSIAPRLWELELCIRLRQLGLSSSVSQIIEYAKRIRNEEEWDIPPLLLLNTLEDRIRIEGKTSSVLEALKSVDGAYPIMSGRVFQDLG